MAGYTSTSAISIDDHSQSKNPWNSAAHRLDMFTARVMSVLIYACTAVFSESLFRYHFSLPN